MALHEYDFKKIGVFFLGIIMVIGAFGGILAGIYFYTKYQAAQTALQSATTNSLEEKKTLVEKVGKLINIPTDEEPTIATVTDLERLKNQPFFAKAKVGDRVLLFTKNKKAYLYDPVANKILEVGPLIIPTDASGSATVLGTTRAPQPKADRPLADTPTPTPISIQVVLYNGTEDPQAVKTMEQRMKSVTGVKFSIVGRENTVQKEYANSLLVDVSGKYSAETKAIGATLKIGIGPLPDGEKKPENTDFVIIVGLDRPQ